MTTLFIDLSSFFFFFFFPLPLLPELDVDREENSRLGVYWLIKASEQGNVEATNILKQCLETGQGEVFIANITVLTDNVNVSNVDTSY